MTDAEIRQYIGQKLKECRTEKKMSVTFVAKQVGSSASHVSQIELGYNLPSIITLRKYLDLYGIKSSDVLPF